MRSYSIGTLFALHSSQRGRCSYRYSSPFYNSSLYALLHTPYILPSYRDCEVPPTFLFCRRGFLTPIKLSRLACFYLASEEVTPTFYRPAKGGAPTNYRPSNDGLLPHLSFNLINQLTFQLFNSYPIKHFTFNI